MCGRWARLAFLRAREKKALVVVIAKIDEACQSNSCLPAPDRRLIGAGMSSPDRGSIGEWSGRRERFMAVRECCLRPLHARASFRFPVATPNAPLTFLQWSQAYRTSPRRSSRPRWTRARIRRRARMAGSKGKGKRAMLAPHPSASSRPGATRALVARKREFLHIIAAA